MYKIKQKPEDFIVKEVSNVNFLKEGKYIYCLLKKREQNTLSAIKEISKKLRIKEKQIGFAGSKDKHAVTEQVISIIGTSKKQVLEKTDLSFLGFGNQPISLGDLEGNNFEVVIREVKGKFQKKINFIPNYFDEQRFSKNNAKIGKFLILKKFSRAVTLIDNAECVKAIKSKPTDYVGALKRIPLRLLRMYVNSYQSYLFNEILSRYLKKKANKTVKYSLGDFVFVDKKEEDLLVPLIGFSKPQVKGKIKDILEKLLSKEKITYKDFIIRQIPKISLEGEMRKAFVEVKNFEIKEEKDSVKLKFFLPKGSYATVVIKALFS